MTYQTDGHRRALRALGAVLMADDPSTWGGLSVVFRARLTLTERLRITTAGLASLPDPVMEDLRKDYASHPSFVLDRIGADRWAELADRQDQRLIMGACWRRMQDRDRRAFLEFAGVCHDREVIHAV